MAASRTSRTCGCRVRSRPMSVPSRSVAGMPAVRPSRPTKECDGSRADPHVGVATPVFRDPRCARLDAGWCAMARALILAILCAFATPAVVHADDVGPQAIETYLERGRKLFDDQE